jgi:hypothetical protein
MNRIKYCADCNIQIDFRSERCRSCSKKGIKKPQHSKRMLGRKNPNYKKGKHSDNKNKCIDCNKELVNYKAKRCLSCARKYQMKINPSSSHFYNRKGNLNYLYKDGRTNKKYYCINCGKELSKSAYQGTKRCRPCEYKRRKGIPTGRICITGKTIIKHHINLNKKNNNRKNKLILTQSIHSSLHHKAYNYLVKKGMIRKYIKWFINNELNHTERKLIRKLNEN